MSTPLAPPAITAACSCGSAYASAATLGQTLAWIDTLQWDTPAYLIAQAITEALVTQTEGVKR